MDKKKTEKKMWFNIAVGGIVASIISMFLPILKSHGMGFNIIDFIVGNEFFNRYVVLGYHGPHILTITSLGVLLLALLAVGALICAVIGLLTLRAQRPNTMNFVLTIVGLIGILLPSVITIACVLVFGNYYEERLVLGVAPIMSPVAVLISLGAVVRRKNKVAEELRKQVEAKGLIWKAGDLN